MYFNIRTIRNLRYKLTRFKNANIGIYRCPDHDAPTAVGVHFTYTMNCKAFITMSVDSNPFISMVNGKPGLVGGCLKPNVVSHGDDVR